MNAVISPTERNRRFFSLSIPVFFLFVADPGVESVIVEEIGKKV